MKRTDASPTGDADRLPLGRHLEELRRRLLRCLLVVACATTAAFAFAPAVFRWMLRPYQHFLASQQVPLGGAILQTLQPAETLKMSVQLSLLIGTALVLPYLLYQIWGFVREGLTERERRWLGPALGGGAVLFAVGVLFAYYAVLPVGLQFFWEYSVRLGITPAWSVAHYIGFVISTLAGFGLAFELPLLILLLAALGLVTPQMLTTRRRHAYFLIAVLAAVLTPPDAFSLCLMAVPMLGLYELSVVLARLVTPRGCAAKTDNAEPAAIRGC